MHPSATSIPVVGLVMPLASHRGGAEGLFQTLLRARGRSFRYKCLFLQDGPLAAEARSLGYETSVIETTHLSDLRNYVSTVNAVRDWIKKSRLDLVFSWMQKAHLYAAPAAFNLRTRLMWFQHGIPKNHWMDVLGAALPADGTLCCSNYVKHIQDRQFLSCVTFACHPGVPMSTQRTISMADAREQLGLRSDGQVVCMVARLERWKGAHVFIEAAHVLQTRFPDAKFFIVGGAHPLDEQYAVELDGLIKAHKLDNCFHLIGQRPSSEIPLWHASADIIVHPVTEAEPFGMAVVEALAAGCTVVASSIGGVIEIIEDGVSGVFVPPGDATALADAASDLLLDAAKRERIESAAAMRACAFSVEAFVARFESIVSLGLAS